MHAMSDGSRATAEPSSIVEAAALRPRHAVASEPAPANVEEADDAHDAHEEAEEEHRASPAAMREAEAPLVEKSIPISMDTSEEAPRVIERSNTAPSVERARRAAAASQTALTGSLAPSPGVALSPKESRGWGILTVLLVLGVAGAAGTYWCGMQASTPEPDPATKTP
jgi:hypothetical protein